MKTKPISLLTAALLAGPTLAGGAEPQALIYLDVPFGGSSARENPASFGFMLRQGHIATPSRWPALRQVPIFDFRFTANGDKSIRAMGFETYRLRAGEESGGGAPTTPPVEVNWLLVGGVAIGAAAVIANEERKSKNQPTTTPGIGGGGL